MSVYEKLKALNISLPEVAMPAAAYLPYMQTGNLVFLSGHIAKQNGQPWVGKLGENMTTEGGKQAARAGAVDLMGTLQHACGGDLRINWQGGDSSVMLTGPAQTVFTGEIEL